MQVLELKTSVIGSSTNGSGFLNSITLSLVMVCVFFLLRCFLSSRTLKTSWKDTPPNLSNTTFDYILIGQLENLGIGTKESGKCYMSEIFRRGLGFGYKELVK